MAPDGRRAAVVFVPLNGRFETAERDTFYRIMTARIARAYRENVALAGRGWDDLLEEQSRCLRRPPPDGLSPSFSTALTRRWGGIPVT